MTRDEILAEIERLSTGPIESPAHEPNLFDLEDRTREIARLADAYLEDDAGDTHYLAEALTAAMHRLADLIGGNG